MILKLNKNNLEAIDKRITSSDSLIILQTDLEDVTIFGIVKFFDGTKKVIQFINDKENSGKKFARLIIREDDIKYLESANIYLEKINGEMSKKTNIVPIEFDISLIKTDIKIHYNEEFKEVLEKVNELAEKIQYNTISKIAPALLVSNKDAIKKGMVPVAIDDNGHFAAMYPFADHVVSVNGVTAANGAVVIDSSMIQYKTGKSVEKSIDDLAEASKALADALRELSNIVTTLNSRADELDMRLTQHINNGII